jgi:hypothetical protein
MSLADKHKKIKKKPLNNKRKAIETLRNKDDWGEICGVT